MPLRKANLLGLGRISPWSTATTPPARPANIRILKSACHARRQEKILGNVVSGTMPRTPVVAVKYKVGVEDDPREWAGQGEDEFISRVSVFDSQCAAVYLTEKTDVAFR